MIIIDNHDRYSFTIFYSFLDLTIQNRFAIFAYTSETAASKISNQTTTHAKSMQLCFFNPALLSIGCPPGFVC